MCKIEYNDEQELPQKICDILNQNGYRFEQNMLNGFYEIVDSSNHIFGIVKTNNKFAPHQLLYGIVKEKIKNTHYLLLANDFELRVYPSPDFQDILAFVKKHYHDLSLSPDEFTSLEQEKEAYDLLGTHTFIYTYDSPFKINTKQPYLFLTNESYGYFKEIMTRYRIDPAKFFVKFGNSWMNNTQLRIKEDNKTIFDQTTGNQMETGREIRSTFDRDLIQNIRIKTQNVREILHRIDDLAPLDVRRKRGKFWSSMEVSEIVSALIKIYVNPTFIFEPFVGGGSLIAKFVPTVPGIMNDIDASSVVLLEQKWKEYPWRFYKQNLFLTPQKEINNEWGIPSSEETERFLIYTNPPFGTSSTNKLASSKKDVAKMNERGVESRSNIIEYGSDKNEEQYFGDKYGRGDLVIPAIARMIEVIRHRHDGYLAFFSPFGVMLGRYRYKKVLKALLQDFEFLYGEVFDGNMFNNVAKKKAISFTIWKYKKRNYTSQEDLSFWYNYKEYHTKFLPLLKDGWQYDTRTPIEKTIGVQHCETFNASVPKIFHTQIEKGGSPVLPKNVMIELKIQNIHCELIYALWSVCVGLKAIIQHPIIFDNCYTHLPDFEQKETFEILAYIVIHTIITDHFNNYSEGLIGFIEDSRDFTFGNQSLTDGASYLIETYGSCKIGAYSIQEVFDRLQQNEDPDDIDKKLRINIKQEIEQRLDEIGYWDDLPVPSLDIHKKDSNSGLLKFIDPKKYKA